jgi:hypothetical protein
MPPPGAEYNSKYKLPEYVEITKLFIDVYVKPWKISLPIDERCFPEKIWIRQKHIATH